METEKTLVYGLMYSTITWMGLKEQFSARHNSLNSSISCIRKMKGVPLTSEYLSDSYGKLNAKYYGPAVEEDPEIKFEWSRIPHFIIITMFSNTRLAFCCFSTGEEILNQEPEALENYLAYLKAGNSDYPVEVMKKQELI